MLQFFPLHFPVKSSVCDCNQPESPKEVNHMVKTNSIMLPQIFFREREVEGKDKEEKLQLNDGFHNNFQFEKFYSNHEHNAKMLKLK